VFKTVLDCHNSAKQLLSSSICLLALLLNFLGTKKSLPKIDQKARGVTSWFSSKIKQSRFWLQK